MKTKAKEAGQCPVCNSEVLEYVGDTKSDGDCIGYLFFCEDCKAEGIEWYKLIFDELEIIEKEEV